MIVRSNGTRYCLGSILYFQSSSLSLDKLMITLKGVIDAQKLKSEESKQFVKSESFDETVDFKGRFKKCGVVVGSDSLMFVGDFIVIGYKLPLAVGF